MAKAAKKWSLVDMEFRDRAKEESKPKSGNSSQNEGARNTQMQGNERPNTLIACSRCGEQGHTLRQRREVKAGSANVMVRATE